MSARHKLNQAVVQGTLLVAGLLGLVTQSWTIFAIAAVTLLALSIHSGDIRFGPRPRKGRYDD